jgi:hypothetical protein
LALERSWVITASTHMGLRSAGIVWFLLPARIARQGLGNVTIFTKCRNLPAGGIRLPAWTTRSRGAVREQVDLATLSGDLLAVVEQTMQPTTVSLWLRPPAERSTQRPAIDA